MPFRVKLVKCLPTALNARVAYLCVPCEKSQMWVVNPAQATIYGLRDDAVKTVAILQLAAGTYEIEECGSKPAAPVRSAAPPKKSFFD